MSHFAEIEIIIYWRNLNSVELLANCSNYIQYVIKDANIYRRKINYILYSLKKPFPPPNMSTNYPTNGLKMSYNPYSFNYISIVYTISF